MTFEQVLRFAAKQKVALVGSVDQSGFPNVKAMLAPRVWENGGVMYFTTNTSSRRAAQYIACDKACVYFFRKGLFSYRGVQFTGTMEVLTDPVSRRKIWRRGDTVYYRGGVDDPDYCVLRFTPISARYYCDLKTEDIPFGDIGPEK